MEFAEVTDRSLVTVDGYRYLVVVVKELPDWRSLAIFDYESGRIAAEVEWAGVSYRVFLPLDDRTVYVGPGIECAIRRVVSAERAADS